MATSSARLRLVAVAFGLVMHACTTSSLDDLKGHAGTGGTTDAAADGTTGGGGTTAGGGGLSGGAAGSDASGGAPTGGVAGAIETGGTSSGGFAGAASGGTSSADASDASSTCTDELIGKSCLAVTSGNAACDQCMIANCCTAIDTCLANKYCAELFQCVIKQCGGQSSASGTQCAVAKCSACLQGASTIVNTMNCLQAKCQTSCSPD